MKSRRKSNAKRIRELPPNVNVPALIEFLETVDGHDIIKSDYFTGDLGFPQSFVADVEQVHVSRAGDPKQTIYKGGDIVSATRGVHDLRFVSKLYYDLGMTGAADKLGRGSQTREYARVILEYLKGVGRKKNPLRKGFLPPRDNRKRLKKELQKCVEEWKVGVNGEEWPTLIKYAWPGGYTVIYITKKGDVLCPDCAQAEVDEFLEQDDDSRHGWTNDDPVIGCQTYDEGPDEECANCNDPIESSYGDPDDEQP